MGNRRAIGETYHDFVIKDGRFIGKFEEMYRSFGDPWMQSSQPNKISREAGIHYIKDFGIKSVLECGCGLGYYANWIYKATGIIPKGIDISETAISRARKMFPHLNFDTGNVATDLYKYRSVDCVLFSEILWYILPHLNDILTELKDRFRNKYLIINQVFYKGTQKYGTDYFTTMRELINYIPFPLSGFCEASKSFESTVETSTIYQIK